MALPLSWSILRVIFGRSMLLKGRGVHLVLEPLKVPVLQRGNAPTADAQCSSLKSVAVQDASSSNLILCVLCVCQRAKCSGGVRRIAHEIISLFG